MTQLVDLSVTGNNIADFDLILEKRTVIIPTFYDNHVEAVGFL